MNLSIIIILLVLLWYISYQIAMSLVKHNYHASRMIISFGNIARMHKLRQHAMDDDMHKKHSWLLVAFYACLAILIVCVVLFFY